MHRPFDLYTEDYDLWFVSRGKEVYRYELRAVCGELPPGPALEVGVGTGRFAGPLGVRFGLDPSLPSLRMARERLENVVAGRGEALPFKDGSFSVVLLIVTVCFLDDVEATLSEIRRVLKERGRLILGYVPADSRIGREYARKGAEGHRFYAHARFWRTEDLMKLLGRYGFRKEEFRSVVRRGDGYAVVPWESEDTVFSVLRTVKVQSPPPSIV